MLIKDIISKNNKRVVWDKDTESQKTIYCSYDIVDNSIWYGDKIENDYYIVLKNNVTLTVSKEDYEKIMTVLDTQSTH